MVASNTERRATITLDGKDNASGVIAAAGKRIKSSLQDLSGASFGPAVKPRFKGEEQEIRDRMAGRVRAMRDTAKRARIDEEVQARLFGARAAQAAIAEPTELAAKSLGRLSSTVADVGQKSLLKRLKE